MASPPSVTGNSGNHLRAHFTKYISDSTTTTSSTFKMRSKLTNLITILGNTGVGKSQLSIEIAKAVNGEIINGDSMQVYEGLDNMTNKHPIAERENIPHHLLGHIAWSEEYSVKQFEEEAIRLIENISARGKVPILVGGTHYYLQSILFKNSTVSGITSVDSESKLTKEQTEILDGDPDSVFAHLLSVDPQVAGKFHPNDTRRVRRALEIYFATNKKASDIYLQQQTQNSDQAARLRYRSLILLVWAEKQVLNERLDNRVDSMLLNGLEKELDDMYKEYLRMEKEVGFVDLQRGIWQVIGFKQFLPWLKQEASKEQCIEAMKQVTRSYAQKQTKWINKKLLSMINSTKSLNPELVGDVALLDSTDMSKWDENVGKRGVLIAEEFCNSLADSPINYRVPLVPPGREADIMGRSSDETFSAEKWKHFVCEFCHDSHGKRVICIGEQAWNTHRNSRKHKREVVRKTRPPPPWLNRKNNPVENKDPDVPSS